MKMDETELEDTVDDVEELIQAIGYPETNRVELPPPRENNRTGIAALLNRKKVLER